MYLCMYVIFNVQLLALGVCAISGWQFSEAYNERDTAAFKAAQAVGETTTDLFKVFGSNVKVDLVKANRVKLACYGTAFASAALQFLTSLLILICPAAKVLK